MSGILGMLLPILLPAVLKVAPDVLKWFGQPGNAAWLGSLFGSGAASNNDLFKLLGSLFGLGGGSGSSGGSAPIVFGGAWTEKDVADVKAFLGQIAAALAPKSLASPPTS